MNNSNNDEVQNNNDQQLGGQKQCQCQDKHGVFLTSRRVGWLVSSLVVFCFFIFIAGYFFGKKNAVEKFYDKIEQDSFADHIYYSMCSMYDKGSAENNNGGGTEAATEGEGEDTEKAVTPVKAGEKPQVKAVAPVSQGASAVKKEDGTTAIADKHGQKTEEKEQTQYYAELVGFGTKVAAQKCAEQLKKKNITVLVKPRHSKTSRGHVTTWYQVVTEMFSDKKDLMAFVDDVSARKRLKDVRIVSC